MELREYVKIIKKRAKLIASAGVLAGLSALFFSSAQPVRYETSLSLLIGKKGTQQTDNFKYDGYYALETSEFISDSVQQWLKSPETVNAIFQKSRVAQNFKDIKEYTKKFTVKKMSAQYVEVGFKTANKEDGQKIAAAVTDIINAKIGALEKNSDGELSYSASAENPVTAENKPDIPLNLAIGLISGLFLGIMLALAKEYFS